MRALVGRAGRIGAGLILAISAVAVLGLLLPDDAGRARVAEPYARPRAGLPLGADDFGRDLFAQLVVGAGRSLGMAFLVATIVTVTAAIVGGAAGIGPRWLSALLMRATDVVLSLPELALMILAVAFLGQTFGIRVAVMTFLLWPSPARVVRAGTLSAWSRGHLEVARAMGAPHWWLLARHASYVVGPLLIPIFVRTAGRVVLYDAALAFLGLGDPTTASWGTTLHWAQVSGVFLSDAWIWWAVPPGVAITLTVVALGLVGVSVEERLNPALRGAR